MIKVGLGIMGLTLLLAAPVRAQTDPPNGAPDCRCVMPSAGAAQADSHANLPGWTGRTFVIGSHSTIAEDATATRNQQTGQYGTRH
jgi:hypothetical protein